MKRVTAIALVLTTLFLLAGCTSSQAAGPAPTTSSPQTVSPVNGLLAGLESAVEEAYGGLIASAAPAPSTATASSSSADLLSALEATLGDIYTEVNPSVVNIRVVQTAEGLLPHTPQIPGIPVLPEQPYSQGAGSGFVWDQEGHIVTNNHVVDGADKIEVIFHDGVTVQAEMVGSDPDSDLAVVKVDVAADRLQPVQVADSTQVRVGQLAVAIGNPFALEGTMTVGFVSALGRSLPVNEGISQGPSYTIPDIIQTDAPINPGNSGGVLVDDQGRLIGVTAAIESPVRANAGIGFAIPSAVVANVVPSLIETGQYDHPWLGISGTDLSPALAEDMDLALDQRGALVVDVVVDSPADRGGVQGSGSTVEIDGQELPVGGDLIVAIDGQPVREFDDIVRYLARETKVGQTVILTVLRQGDEQKLEVTLEARPTAQAQTPALESGQNATAWLGISGLTLTPHIATEMHLQPDQQGILIQQVQPGSPADEAGLRGGSEPATINGQQLLIGGDVIIALEGKAVSDIGQLRALVGQAEPGQQVTLTLLRDAEQVDIMVVLAERP